MEISFKDILRILKKNVIFICVISLIFAFGSFFITKFFIPKTYTSTVKLYVEASAELNKISDNINAYNYAQKLVLTYIQMLDTNKFYSELSKNLDEKYTPTELSKSITFTSVEDTEVFMATIVADSPTAAKEIGDGISNTAPETIKALLSDTAVLKIVDDATLPQNPTSPSVSKNVLLAFAAGLIISVIISFLRDYFDIKIKYNEEMTTLCGIPVLSAIPDFETITASKGGKK